MGFEGPLFCAARQIQGLLPAETIEFPVPYASEKCVPFIWCKSENRSFGVPAVADTDLVAG